MNLDPNQYLNEGYCVFRNVLSPLEMKKKIEFCLVVESEGTANTIVTNGITSAQAGISADQVIID